MSTKNIKNLVIVESPAKAKKISNYLGKDYVVMASVGHIRSVAKKAPKGQKPIDTDHNFETIYEIDPEKADIVKELKAAVKKAETVWLASDEDREGEAIAWHLCQVLGLDPTKTNRITYHEITKSAIQEAIRHPRHIDMNLVHAQQARQILDRLVGFELSPVVWRKVPGGKSAGRVQSPAVRLLVEREREIQSFQPIVTFKTTGELKTTEGDTFKATLSQDFSDEKQAEEFLASLNQATLTVADIKQTTGIRHPLPPFTTSTMQQDANAKLGFSASATMTIAQRLYQAGYITYMRTDSVNLSSQALAQASSFIKDTYGINYYQFRTYKTKTAGAQEAHEAIRPTDINRETVPGDERTKKLYQLIRSRTLATQMTDAKIDRTTVTIDINGHDEKFVAKGEVVTFDGFLKVYGVSKDELLPRLKVANNLTLVEATSRQTYSRPPARYTEGSLVKKLEELEIGRPSTYATIISNIQTRGYVVRGNSDGVERDVIELSTTGSAIKKQTVKEKFGATKGKLVPTDAGMVVSDFLVDYFNDIVDYGFTANVEKELDDIAADKLDKVKMLRNFYDPFHAKITQSDQIDRSAVAGQRLVGVDPNDGQPIYARLGRYGAMLQKGDSNQPDSKITFANMPAGATIGNVTLDQAIRMFSLPRIVGKTADGEQIIANIGRFGPYIKVGKTFVSIKPDSPFDISESRARELYQTKLDAEAAKHIATWGDVQVLNGRYGPYITDGTKNVKIPKELELHQITEEQAKEILAKAPTKTTNRNKAKTRKTTRKSSSRAKKK